MPWKYSPKNENYPMNIFKGKLRNEIVPWKCKICKKKTHIKNKSYKHNIHLKMKIMKWKYWL